MDKEKAERILSDAMGYLDEIMDDLKKKLNLKGRSDEDIERLLLTPTGVTEKFLNDEEVKRTFMSLEGDDMGRMAYMYSLMKEHKRDGFGVYSKEEIQKTGMNEEEVYLVACLINIRKTKRIIREQVENNEIDISRILFRGVVLGTLLCDLRHIVESEKVICWQKSSIAPSVLMGCESQSELNLKTTNYVYGLAKKHLNSIDGTKKGLNNRYKIQNDLYSQALEQARIIWDQGCEHKHHKMRDFLIDEYKQRDGSFPFKALSRGGLLKRLKVMLKDEMGRSDLIFNG